MTNPTEHTKTQTAEAQPAAVFARLQVLKNRSEFIAASKAQRVSAPSFNLQARPRRAGEADGIRVGFTCSKKVGNAVARNRAKRRLREIARLVLPSAGRDGYDYVLVGRPSTTAARNFEALLDDLRGALEKVHA